MPWYIGDRVEYSEPGLTYLSAPTGFTRQIGIGPKVIFELPVARAGVGQLLADDINGDLGANRAALVREAGLGSQLVSTRLHSAIMEILSLHTDAQGTPGWNPLQGPDLQIWMNGGLIVRKRLNPTDPEWPLQMSRIRASLDLAATRDQQLARMMLYRYMQQFGVDPETQDPTPFHPSLTPTRPATLRTETFAGSADALGSDFTWNEYDDVDRVSGRAKNGTASLNNGNARCETGPGGANMYAEVDVPTFGTSHNSGPCIRYNASAQTFVVYLTRNSSSNTHRLYKVTAASYTQIGSTQTGNIPSVTFTQYLEGTSADAITGKIDTVTRVGPETDSHQSSSTLWGISCGMFSSGQYTEYEEARSDLLAAAGFAHSQGVIIG